MKILLIQPPLNQNVIGAGMFFISEPLALETIGAMVSNYEVKLLDMRVDKVSLQHALIEFMPDIVGITSLTQEVNIVKRLFKEIKNTNKNIVTVIGGQHATLLPHDFYDKNIDTLKTHML